MRLYLFPSKILERLFLYIKIIISPASTLAMDFERICRLCLTSQKQKFNIFTSVYLKRNILYLDMLSYCTKLKLATDDGLPKLICKECIKLLKKTYNFNLQCEKNDKKLRLYLTKLEEASSYPNSHDLVIKNEHDQKDLKNCLDLDFHESEQKVLEMLDQNVADFKDNIKMELSYNDGEDSCWDADDNILLEDIKITKMHDALENEVKPKKKRGRKKKEYLEGELPSLPISKTPHQCDICGKVLSTKSNLKQHKICHTDIRPYKCNDCPAEFRGHSALFQHKKVHTGETPYHCEYCPKQFSRRGGLVNHIRMHTGEKQFGCEICLKTFVQSAQLSIHMKRHKGDKPYLCQDCGKGFPIKADLKVHQRIHSGEKPYSCHMCSKTFATSGNLSIHIRIHKKEIRYNCKECNRGFVTSSAYKVHLKRHKGQRDYTCECNKTFYTLSALKQHRVVHTGEKKYQCKICERKFTQTSHLSRHFKRDHCKPNMPVPSSDYYKVVLRNTYNNDKLFGVIDMPDKKLDEIDCDESQR